MLEDAVALQRAGRYAEAATAYERILSVHPEHADAWQLLGLVRRHLDAPQAALDALDRCLALEPDHAPAWANRGLVLQSLGRDDEAIASYRRAARHRPGFKQPLLNLARIEARHGRFEAAMASLRPILDAHPDDDDALRLQGLLHAQRGEHEQAVDSWSRALRTAFEPALAVALGQLQLQRGRPDLALVPLVEACRQGAPAWALLADAAVQSPTFPADASDVLAAAMGRDDIDHQRLERAVRAQLAPLDDDALLAHPLTPLWLTRCLVQHPDDLRRLPHLHRRLFDDARAGRDVPVSLAAAFAVQAWITEHASPLLDVDLDALPDGSVRTALGAILAPLPATTLPLPAPLDALWARTVGDALREAAILPTVPVLSLGDDTISSEVRALYEANPYPRLVTVHRPVAMPLQQLVAPLGIQVPPARPLKVLVAGGGTGQHPLQTAARYSDVDVLAIDLSRRSLARATRVATDAGIANVRFAQADILALGDWAERFDVIESVGVLHHLADPLAGWTVLRGLLRPDGLMRIGLYAERGRTEIVAARALIEQWGLQPTPEGIAEARRRFLELSDDHPAHPVVWSPDFPSLSGLRDLVFHVCEHRYTLPRLAAELDALDLRFAGFQHTMPQAALRYRERWPDDTAQADLGRWDALEADHPRLFSGMYVFWVCPR